jgi:hypothetical protein
MGTPGSPPTRLTTVPNKWVRPTRRPADLSVGPTDLVGSPHDLHVRHWYPWVPTDHAHSRPRQVGPAYQKTRRPVGGPNRPSWRPTRPPEDSLGEKTAWRARQGSPDGLRQLGWAFHDVNRLEIGFPVVTDLDSGPPTLSVAQYKAGKGVLPGTTSRPSTGRHVISPRQQYKPKNWT